MASAYTTVQGDTWDMIAFKLWGREMLCDRLMRANPEHLEVVVFDAGVVLAVPEVPEPQPSADLPPWRR